MSSVICRQQSPRSVCSSGQSDQGLHCLLTESLDTTECMNIWIKHGFSCTNICQVPWKVLKTEAEGLSRDLTNVNALQNHVRSLLLHKNWKYLLHFALFLALVCFAFSLMSRKWYFYRLCAFWGRAVHISWRQQFCGPGTSILKVP